LGELDDLADAVSKSKAPKPQISRPQPLIPQNDERIWTIHDKGRQFGPHTERELAVLLGSGQVSSEALVWRVNSPRWIPITNLVPAPPPVPPPAPKSHSVASNGSVMVNIHNTVGYPAFMSGHGNAFGTASLVLGIITTVLFCIPFISIPTGILGFILGMVGIITGISQNKPTGTSIAGCILSAALFVIIIVFGAAISASMH
jgi:hypothetical protein